jgi:hypothetical protein
VQPAWVVPVVLLVLLAVLIAGDPGRIDRQRTWLRVVTGIVIAFLTAASLLAAARLVVDILTSNKLFAHNPTGLLATGGVVWATNVIAFGLWYWDLDRGGAAARAHPQLLAERNQERMAARVTVLPHLRDGQRGNRLVAGEQPGGMCGDDPRALPADRYMLAEPGGGHDAVAGLQNHRVAGDVKSHSGPPFSWEGLKASDKPSDNAPRQRQTERDVLRHSMPSEVR